MGRNRTISTCPAAGAEAGPVNHYAKTKFRSATCMAWIWTDQNAKDEEYRLGDAQQWLCPSCHAQADGVAGRQNDAIRQVGHAVQRSKDRYGHVPCLAGQSPTRIGCSSGCSGRQLQFLPGYGVPWPVNFSLVPPRMPICVHILLPAVHSTARSSGLGPAGHQCAAPRRAHGAEGCH